MVHLLARFLLRFDVQTSKDQEVRGIVTVAQNMKSFVRLLPRLLPRNINFKVPRVRVVAIAKDSLKDVGKRRACQWLLAANSTVQRRTLA